MNLANAIEFRANYSECDLKRMNYFDLIGDITERNFRFVFIVLIILRFNEIHRILFVLSVSFCFLSNAIDACH